MADTAQSARFDTTEFFSQSLEDRDPELFEAIRKERTRQQQQIELMQELGKKSEQQSLAKYGLDFVTDTYLPEKLAHPDVGLSY